MKKLVKFFPMLLIALVGSMMFMSCDDDKDESITTDVLPAQAKEFIRQYFPAANVVSAVKDHDEYEVTLSEGTHIDFDMKGEWKDVEAAIGKTIPSGFYPEAIDTYVSTNFEGVGINEISKERRGYDVELVTGTDLMFDSEGTFIGVDL